MSSHRSNFPLPVLALMLVVASASGNQEDHLSRDSQYLPPQASSRAIHNLIGMMINVFGNECSYLNDFGNLSFSYGCYCGLFSGNDNSPVDKWDEICQAHDECYDRVQPRKWWQTQRICLHVLDYDYDIDGNMKITCKDSNDSCEFETCECDRIVTEELYQEYQRSNTCPFVPLVSCP